jgi:hypothetical protein
MGFRQMSLKNWETGLVPNSPASKCYAAKFYLLISWLF